MRKRFLFFIFCVVFLFSFISCRENVEEKNALTEKQIKRLESELEKIEEKIKTEADKIPYMIRKAEIQYNLGQKKEAEKFISELIERYPHNPDVLMKKVFYLYNNKDIDSAKEVLIEIKNSFPEYAPALAVYGLILFEEGETAEAFKILRDADKLEEIEININEYRTHDSEFEFTSDNLRRRFYNHQRTVNRMNEMDIYGNFSFNRFHFTLAKMFYDKKWPRSCRQQCRKILIFDNKDIPTLLLIADVYLYLKEEEKAIRVLEYALKLDEENQDTFYSICEKSFKIKDYLKAKKYLELFLKKFPDSEKNIDAMSMLAEIYFEFSIFEKADKLYDGLIKKTGDDSYKLRKAKLYIKWGNVKEAREILDKLTKQKDVGFRARIILAEISIDNDDIEGSWSILKSLKASNIDDPETYYLLSSLYYKLYKENKHQELFKIAGKEILLIYFPDKTNSPYVPEKYATSNDTSANEVKDDFESPFVDIHEIKSPSVNTTERKKVLLDHNLILDLAVIEAEGAVEMDSDNPEYQYALGIYLYEKGRLFSEDYNREYFSYRRMRGQPTQDILMLKEEGDKYLDKSIHHFLEALKNDPGNSEYLRALAWSYYLRRKLSNAYETFQLVLKRDPFNLEVIFALKDLKERL
mgnify:CR=1 FL=1